MFDKAYDFSGLAVSLPVEMVRAERTAVKVWPAKVVTNGVGLGRREAQNILLSARRRLSYFS
ncbi:MAG: hypothetical protein WCJ07_02345 [Verrucomicrobiota bacterium]